jgi:hypothetical protein
MFYVRPSWVRFRTNGEKSGRMRPEGGGGGLFVAAVDVELLYSAPSHYLVVEVDGLEAPEYPDDDEDRIHGLLGLARVHRREDLVAAQERTRLEGVGEE